MSQMTDQEVAEEHARIDLQLKRLNLELVTEQLQTLQHQKEAKRLKLQQQERDIRETNAQKELRQARCRHKKGGRNKEGLDRGNSADYAVIQNTFPAGNVEVMCQRCHKEWRVPLLELKATNPDLYLKQLREYRIALEWPTDNEPSGTQIFLITKHSEQPPVRNGGDEDEEPSELREPRVRNRKQKTKAVA